MYAALLHLASHALPPHPFPQSSCLYPTAPSYPCIPSPLLRASARWRGRLSQLRLTPALAHNSAQQHKGPRRKKKGTTAQNARKARPPAEEKKTENRNETAHAARVPTPPATPRGGKQVCGCHKARGGVRGRARRGDAAAARVRQARGAMGV